MVKTIRKLACEEFLPAKYARAKLKSLQKGFICFFLKIIATLLLIILLYKNTKSVQRYNFFLKYANLCVFFSFLRPFPLLLSCFRWYSYLALLERYLPPSLLRPFRPLCAFLAHHCASYRIRLPLADVPASSLPPPPSLFACCKLLAIL